MEAWTHQTILWLLNTLSLPEIGLSGVFIISLVSATLLPLGSTPAVLAYLSLAPSMFWPTIIVATLGNTLGGGISYWMGLGANKAYEKWRQTHPLDDDKDQLTYSQKAAGRWNDLITNWLHRLGPKALFFAWLPLVGDPLCAVAGWMRLAFIPSLIYMCIGKFLRYIVIALSILWLLPYFGWAPNS